MSAPKPPPAPLVAPVDVERLRESMRTEVVAMSMQAEMQHASLIIDHELTGKTPPKYRLGTMPGGPGGDGGAPAGAPAPAPAGASRRASKEAKDKEKGER